MSKWIYIQDKDNYAVNNIKGIPLFEEIKEFLMTNKELVNSNDWPGMVIKWKEKYPHYCIEVLFNFLNLCGIEDLYLDKAPNSNLTRYSDLRCWKEIK